MVSILDGCPLSRLHSLRSSIRQVTFLLIAGVALAQTATSRITFTVGDASGALVPGAMVTARNEATGVTYTQTTTEAGLFLESEILRFARFNLDVVLDLVRAK